MRLEEHGIVRVHVTRCVQKRHINQEEPGRSGNSQRSTQVFRPQVQLRARAEQRGSGNRVTVPHSTHGVYSMINLRKNAKLINETLFHEVFLAGDRLASCAKKLKTYICVSANVSLKLTRVLVTVWSYYLTRSILTPNKY